jgi:Rrf2 family protein
MVSISVMRLSEGVEWGVHCAVVLALVPPGQSLPARRLAEYHGIPAPYLAKHLQAMTRAGLVESVPGPRGGFRLRRPAEDVTVLDVVEAIDGTDPAFVCTEIRRRGPAAQTARAYPKPCAVHRVMVRADEAWRAELRGTTVADLLHEVAADASPEAVRRTASWFQEVLR